MGHIKAARSDSEDSATICADSLIARAWPSPSGLCSNVNNYPPIIEHSIKELSLGWETRQWLDNADAVLFTTFRQISTTRTAQPGCCKAHYVPQCSVQSSITRMKDQASQRSRVRDSRSQQD